MLFYKRENLGEGNFEEGYYHHNTLYSGLKYNKNLKDDVYLSCISNNTCTRKDFNHFNYEHKNVSYVFVLYKSNTNTIKVTIVFKNKDKYSILINKDKNKSEYFNYKLKSTHNCTYEECLKLREQKIQDFIKETLGNYIKERRKIWYSPDYVWKSSGLSMIDKMRNLQNDC